MRICWRIFLISVTPCWGLPEILLIHGSQHLPLHKITHVMFVGLQTPVTGGISITNHGFWTYKPTERYQTGAPHCSRVRKYTNTMELMGLDVCWKSFGHSVMELKKTHAAVSRHPCLGQIPIDEKQN